jgi:putative intracellular protease/amidase
VTNVSRNHHKETRATPIHLCKIKVQEQMQVAEYLTTPAMVHGNIVTSRGAGTAMAFALKLVEILKGSAIANKIADLTVANG